MFFFDRLWVFFSYFIIKFIYNKCIYLKSSHRIKSLNKIYLVLEFLIIRINKGIIIEVLTFFTMAYSIYMSMEDLDTYLSSFIFLISVLIKLINLTKNWVKNNQLKQDFPIFYTIIKYILFSLLAINLLILVIIGQKLLMIVVTYIQKLFLNMNIMNKFKDFKLSLDYKWAKDNKPRKPESNFFFDLRNKKKNKKRASYLKKEILNTQNKNSQAQDTTFKEISFSERRGWKETVNIQNKPKFTISEQLNNVRSEFKAYDNQEKKFKKIVVDINKEKENFFPNESRSLFNEYVSVIKILKKNLKSVEKNLKISSKKK